MMYEELVRRLRKTSMDLGELDHVSVLLLEAANAIEELLKAAKSMHTWIFLNSVDEQAAYDECGLTNKMNMALGYGGQFVAELPKEET